MGARTFLAVSAALTTSLPRFGPLALSYLLSAGTLATSSAAQLVTFALLARGLGIEQFGLLITVTAITNVAVQFCGLGANETLVRRVAADPRLYPAALGHTLILLGVTGAILTVIFAAGLPAFVALSSDPSLNAIALLALVVTNVVLVRLVMLPEHVFIARSQIGRANLVNVGFALGRTATAALACGVFAVSSVVEWAFWTLGAHLLIALVALWSIRGFGRPRWTLLRGEVRLGFYFTTPFLFRAVRQNADVMVLGAVAGAEVVGAFSVARRIVETSALMTESLHRLMYPRLSRAAAAGFSAMMPLVGRLSVAAFGLGLVTASAVWLVAPFMPALFGRQFGAMVDDLRAICWLVVLLSLHIAASEAIGAAARHGLRAALYNLCNLAGAALSGVLTYLFLLKGTFLALYLTEIALVLAFWSALFVLTRGGTPPEEAAIDVPGRTVSEAVPAGAAVAAEHSPAALPLRVRVADALTAFAHWPRADRLGEARCHAFQCAEFLEIWLDTIGRARGTRPVFVAIDDAAAEPVMLLALGIDRRHGIGTLAFLDGTVCDYTQPILFPAAVGIDAAAMSRLWRELRERLPPFDLARFEKMPSEVGGIANPLMHLGTSRMAESGHAVSLGGTAEELEKRLPGRSSHRRLRRQLGREMNVALEIAETQERSSEFLDHVFENKARKFEETRVPGFELPGKTEFYTQATRRLNGAALVHLSAIRAGETVVASHWGLVFADRFYNVLAGYSDGKWRRYAPGRMLNDDLIRWCHAKGLRVFDFGIGDESYKDEYCDITVPLHEAILPVTWRGRLRMRGDGLMARLRGSAIWRKLRPYKWVVLRGADRLRSRSGLGAPSDREDAGRS